MLRLWRILGVGVVAFGFVAAGCDNSVDSGGADASVRRLGTVEDATIGAVLIALNTSKLTEGQQGKQKAVSEGVRSLGDTMIWDHLAANQGVLERLNALKVAPKESELSMDITSRSNQTVASLNPLSGAEFDTAFLDSVIASYSDLLQLIDQELLPASGHLDMKAVLESTKTQLGRHLARARELRGPVTTSPQL